MEVILLDEDLVKEKKQFFYINKIILSIILIISFSFFYSTPLSATPLSEKKAQRDSLIKEIYRINEELDETIEKYNFYSEELEKTNTKIKFLNKQKNELNYKLNSMKTELEEALNEIYKYNQLNIAQIVSSTDSISDLVNRIKLFSIAGDNHVNVIKKVEELKNEIIILENESEKHKKTILGLMTELKIVREKIEEKIKEKEKLLTKVKQDIEILERVMYAPVTNFVSPADYSGVLALALAQQGKPYIWGASGPNGFDCSGLIYWVFRKFGIYLPRTVGGQYKAGTPISKSNLQQGDLVFFKNFTHVGIYIGNGNFVHAPHTGTRVRIESLSRPYRVANYCGACRISY
jgi:peptidoglycan hydrolase CwlO-like protein